MLVFDLIRTKIELHILQVWQKDNQEFESRIHGEFAEKDRRAGESEGEADFVDLEVFDEDFLPLVGGLYHDCLGLVFLLLFTAAGELFVEGFLDLIKLLRKLTRPRHSRPDTGRIITILLILPIQNRTDILRQLLLPRILRREFSRYVENIHEVFIRLIAEVTVEV